MRPAAGVAFPLPTAWGSCTHLPMVPCLRRGASAGDAALQESGGNAVARGQLHFSMQAIGGAYRRAPRRSRPGPRVLPSPLLLVSGPGPAWIMPLAGTFMRRRHAPRPECKAPPLIARPQPGGESGRIRAAFRRIARRRMPSTSNSRRDRQVPLQPHRPCGGRSRPQPVNCLCALEKVLCRLVLPAMVPVLNNSAFDLMTRSAFIPRDPAHRSNLQSVELPDGPGYPSGNRDPRHDRTRQSPRLYGRDTSCGPSCAPSGGTGRGTFSLLRRKPDSLR